MITAILLLIVAYLLGSCAFGLWFGRLRKHNLHAEGSGNVGATNSARILGLRIGVLVFILDFAKGVLAASLPFIFHVSVIPAAIYALLAVLGHIASLFDHFHGGKAVATSAGVILVLNPLLLLILAIVFVGATLLFSMISFSSVTVAVMVILWTIVGVFTHLGNIWTNAVLLIVGLIVLYKHRSNIGRIRRHEESLVPMGLNLSHQKKP
ncbi:MAG: glycerol-3-phosphate 1-O-acyltransferase PlsY [Streptococcaceae bacterium]|jgi:glycerol-3-phosphate acyltransferase PlsY|nr:glycerol-3-phosphate 1-O-acyltransferase PlsY [Streptococcaceae bacterium]